MSQTYGTPSSGGAGSDGDQPSDWTNDSSSSTRDVAAEEARGVAGDVKSAGQQTAVTAKDQAAQVAGEAKVQARQVLGQAKQELDSQVQSQHQRAAGGLNALADEIQSLVQGTGDQQGMAYDLAQQANDRVRQAAQWLEQREPGEVLEDVKSFARRRPGTFLAAAAVIGLIGGRLTRGLADEAREDSSQPATGRRIASTPPTSTMGTESYLSPVPGQRAYDEAPTGLPTMPAMPASSGSPLDDPFEDDRLGTDATLTGTPAVGDPLTDPAQTWGGDSSQTHGGENR